jgi:glycosyltransferase involved in cell wall biosynthesis
LKKKKYIFVCQVTRQLCVDILNDFILNGAEVTVFTGEISNTQSPLASSIKVSYLCKYDKSTFVKRVFSWAWFTLQVFFKLMFQSKKSELILVSTPPFLPFLGVFFKKVFGQKYHLMMWDIYPDALLSLNTINKENAIFKLWSRANFALLINANTVITLGDLMADSLRKYGKEKIEPLVIQNWANTSFIVPMPKEDNWFAKKYDQVNKLTILYSGNMGATHDFETLLMAAESLLTYADISFILIGDGAKKKYIASMIEKKALHNVRLLDHQEVATFPFSLASADIGVVTLDEGMGAVSVPSKTYSILAGGSALMALTSKKSEINLLVEKYACGKVFEKGDDKGVEGYILMLHKDKLFLNQLKQNARKAAFSFTPENAKLYYKYICH